MITEAQRVEIDKYAACYEAPQYRMSSERARGARAALGELECRGSYLDVACGRGEMLDHARALGFAMVKGTEVVPALLNAEVSHALAWSLPFLDQSVDVVSLFDVIEHLLPRDDANTCRELVRVARRHILITANNLPSVHDGMDLHVNRRPYQEWDRLFHTWFPGQVTWCHEHKAKASELWRIDL